jgi:hypothetical protein
MRWTSERSGAAEGLEGEFVAGGMGGDYTSQKPSCNAIPIKIARPLLEVQSSAGRLMANGGFAAVF